MNRLKLIAALVLSTLAVSPLSAQTASSLSVKDGAGTSQTMGTGTANSKLFYGFYAAAADGSVAPAATAANQVILNATVGSTPQATGQTIQPMTGSKFDTVVVGASTNIGASVTANTALTLFTGVTGLRGFSIQNQTTGNCYISGLTAATADFNSLLIAAGSYYETKDSHVSSTGQLSVICAASGGVYGRRW